MKNPAAGFLPRSIKRALRPVCHSLMDAFDSLFGKNELVPPVRMSRFTGDPDFEQIGEQFLTYFRELANLQPGNKVLDVGCGIGRLAVPLATYLNEEGRYDGLDIVPMGINWCKRRISPRYPNFHFHLADVFNNQYNPRGRCTPEEYRFPFDGQSFDFVFMLSLFTHMLPSGMEHYLSETARVLKRGGCTLITYFLLNDESLNLMQQGKSMIDFKPAGEIHRVKDSQLPEAAVAYDEGHVRHLYRTVGLSIEEPIHYGFWVERDGSLSGQDIVVAHKA